MASFSTLVNSLLRPTDHRPQGHPNPATGGPGPCGGDFFRAEAPAPQGHTGLIGSVTLATPGSQSTTFAAAQANGVANQMHPAGQAALGVEGSAGFAAPTTTFKLEPPPQGDGKAGAASIQAAAPDGVTPGPGTAKAGASTSQSAPCPGTTKEAVEPSAEPVAPGEGSRKRPREPEPEPGPRHRLKTRGVEADFDDTCELPGVVLDGVAHLAQLGPCNVSTPSIIKRYGPTPAVAALAWVRSAARCAASSPGLVSETTMEYARAAVSSADAFKPFLLRAAVLQSKLVVEDDGREYHVWGVEEDEGEEDDELEGIRSGFSAKVPSVVLPRPALPPPEELRMIQRVVWDPREERSLRVSQQLRELERTQPWRGVLPPHAQLRDGREPSSLEVTRGFKHILYVPDLKAMRALREAQNAHQQAIAEIVGPEKATALGLAQLSGHKELMRWAFRDRQALEEGLANKGITDDGLEWVRKTACPHIRMPSVANYYFKVWRTMTTPAAQAHYATKLARKYEKLRKDHDRTRKLPRPSPDGVYAQFQAAVDAPMRANTPPIQGAASQHEPLVRAMNASRRSLLRVQTTGRPVAQSSLVSSLPSTELPDAALDACSVQRSDKLAASAGVSRDENTPLAGDDDVVMATEADENLTRTSSIERALDELLDNPFATVIDMAKPTAPVATAAEAEHQPGLDAGANGNSAA